MNDSHKLDLVLRSDRELVGSEDGPLHILAEIRAPQSEETGPRQRVPLNLALVIDASGSMSGRPLEAAKRAAMGVVESLQAADRLSVVSFDSTIITHVDAVPCDAAGKEQARAEIAALQPRGTTDLAGGWMRGAECVAREMERRGGTQNHVVLLSDGHANCGITDPAVLAQRAGDLRQRDLVTSTVGIGNGYSPVQLQALAEAGGGRMHDAERPEEIVEVVLAELGEIRRTVAENVELLVDVPEGLAVECLGVYRTLREGGRLGISLGALVAGAARRVLLRLSVPAGWEGTDIVLRVTPAWNRPGEPERRLGTALELCLRRGNFMELMQARLDAGVAGEVASLWQTWLVHRTMTLNESGNHDEAGRFLEVELRSFRAYVRDLPEGRRLLRELERLHEAADYDWDPRAAKEVMLYSLKASKGEPDLRRTKRASWDSFVPDDKKK